MKAEKLFLLINEIDDRLIGDAERTNYSPVEIEYVSRRSPIREIIALAACAAVLIIGVFTVVKLRIGGIDTPSDSGSRSEYSCSDDMSDSSETSEKIPVIDEEFPDVTQIKLPAGSFEEKLRYIMLRAATVEALESGIAEADTDGRVSKVSVTKKTDKTEYLKTGEPVTEGAIKDDMFVTVTLADGVWFRYHVGYVFESSEQSVYDFGREFNEQLEKLAREAETLGGFKAAVAEYDEYKWTDVIHLYRNRDNFEKGIELTDDNTVLEKGMCFYIVLQSGNVKAVFEI